MKHMIHMSYQRSVDGSAPRTLIERQIRAGSKAGPLLRAVASHRCMVTCRHLPLYVHLLYKCAYSNSNQ